MVKTASKNHLIAGVFICIFISAGMLHAANIPAGLETITATDGSTWERVNVPGFGDNNNFSAVAMAEYQGRLYAMTRNESQGTEVWRTNGTGWEQVLFPGGITNGIYGNTRINNVWARMIVFNGKLYFGFSSGLQGNFLGSTGCEIWRYDGSIWEPVISDKKDIDEAGTITINGISGCALADGDRTANITDNTKAWVTNQWAGGVLQITSGTGKFRKFRILSNTLDTLNIQQNETAGTYNSSGQENEYTNCASRIYNNPFPQYSYTLGAVVVGDSYEIGMGIDENGFGNFWNKTITAMRIFNNKLYVSTGLNYEYGGQIWYTENGDDWMVTSSAMSVPAPFTDYSFGNFHSDTAYPGGNKPVSSSVTDLVVSSVSGTPILYAGGTGTSGSQGGCSRMARLTANGWELIVDVNIDTNATGTNENGFGSPPDCSTNTYNFMPWSLSDFSNKLLVGINTGVGARVLYAPSGLTDIKNDGSWQYSVGQANLNPTDPLYVDPLGTSAYLNGFDGYKYTDGSYQNIAVNLFPSGNTLYGGIICQYVPEFLIPPAKSELKGSQIWKSPDGLTWTQVTNNGFGDTETIIFEAFTEFKGQLYVSGSKGSSATPSGLGGAKIYRMVPGCVNVVADQNIADQFTRHTVTGITAPLPVLPDVHGFFGASYVTIGNIDKDINGIKEIISTSGTGLDGNFVTKDGAVAIFTWDGQNLDSWTQSIIYPNGPTGELAWPNETLLRDMDGDGDLDIMVMDNFIAGWFTKAPAGIYYLENQGGDIKLPLNWILRTIYKGDSTTQVGRSSYHRARFLDIDGDGDEDFITSKVCMWNWQNTTLQYNWVEWFRKESSGAFTGPYEIGDGGGFLFELADVDSDGDLDVIGPQFFIQNGAALVPKGPGDIRGDSLAWFENPGTGGPVTQKWNRYTIDNWYTSPNPMGKGFEAIVSDIDNNGKNEIIFTNHNHQDYKPDETYQDRIWPSGIYYMNIPDNPKSNTNWQPVSIDTGDPLLDPYNPVAVANDVYAVDREGGPYTQGSPGMVRAADMNGDGYPELVVPGDGKGAVYYYETGGQVDGCLTYKRASLFTNPGCMPGDAQIDDIDGDGDMDVIAVIYDTSVNKADPLDSSSIFVFESHLQVPVTTTTIIPETTTTTTATPTVINLVRFEAKGKLARIFLKWETASEVDNMGFNIYRAESAEGEYTKINGALIPADGSATEGANYQYIDKTAKAGKTYYYKLEDVDNAGNSTFHGPISVAARFLLKGKGLSK